MSQATVKKAERQDFGVGSVSAAILRLAVPMTLAQLINVLYSVVDRIYIGHLPHTSTEALTGIGLTLPVITMVTAFANLFGMGGAPLFSMERGRENIPKAQRIMGNSFSLLLISSVILSLFCYIFKEPLLYLFGASDTTYPYADAYLSIYLLGTVFVMISLGMNNFINAQGFGVTGMLTVSIGAVLNLILDPVFIFGLNMGIQGAALATILSQFVSAVWVFRFLTGKKAIIPLTRASMRLQGGLVKNISVLGTSGFIMSVTNSAVQIICNATLQQYGGDLYVGIMTVINSVREIANMPVSGLVGGAQPVISYNYGARCYGRTREAIRLLTLYAALYCFLFWASVMAFPRAFIRIFNGEAELIRLGAPAMQAYFCLFFFMALQIAGQHTFVSIGRSKEAIFFSLFRKVILVIPLVWLLPKVLPIGAFAVFFAEPLSDLIGGSASNLAMRRTVWKELLEKEGAPSPTNPS